MDTRKACVEFFSIRQNKEKVLDFALRLKNLAQTSGIKEDSILKFRFISGIRNEQIQYELMKDSEIDTFSKAMARAILIESLLNKPDFEPNSQEVEDEVNKVGQERVNNYVRPNFKNNKKEHQKYEKNQCFFCKKFNHFKKDCFKYKKWLQKQNEKANEVTEEDGISEQIGHIHF